MVASTASRTDAILDAIAGEVGDHDDVLNGDNPPQHVAVMVYLSRTGKVVRVTFEPKWSRDVEREGR
jgi:hypothetical protein